MYIDKIDGIISPDEFLKYREKYNLESQNAQARIDVLNAKLIEMSGVNNPFDAKLVLEKYKHIDVLIFEIVNEFINKVYVGKLKEDGTREIKIIWKI